MRVALGGALIGLAIGCKWAAVPFLGYAGLAILILRFRGTRDRAYWRGLTTPALLLTLVIGAGAAYLLTFLPAFFSANAPLTRSEERQLANEGVRTCRVRWRLHESKKKYT